VKHVPTKNLYSNYAKLAKKKINKFNTKDALLMKVMANILVPKLQRFVVLT